MFPVFPRVPDVSEHPSQEHRNTHEGGVFPVFPFLLLSCGNREHINS